MSEQLHYSAGDQVCALNLQNNISTAAPISEIVTAFLPDYAGMLAEAKAAKKRAKDRNRQQRLRMQPKETSVAKLANALRKAIAEPRGNKQLEQLRDRVGELAQFRYLSRMITAQHGAMSDADLARSLGDGFTRKKAWQLRQIVADLEADGGPWHNI